MISFKQNPPLMIICFLKLQNVSKFQSTVMLWYKMILSTDCLLYSPPHATDELIRLDEDKKPAGFKKPAKTFNEKLKRPKTNRHLLNLLQISNDSAVE